MPKGEVRSDLLASKRQVSKKDKNCLLTKNKNSDIIIFGHWFFIIKNQ